MTNPRPDISEYDLSNVNLSHTDFSGSDDLQGKLLSGANLSGANLSYANLSGANLSGANLSDANLNGANLSETNLGGANLCETNLSGANLGGANLYEANLSEANLSGANMGGANLSETNLSGANLCGANLIDVNLRGVDLERANLERANLSGANLSDANLSDANLSGANLSGAYLEGTNLGYTDLSGADITKTELTGTTILTGTILEGANLSWSVFTDTELYDTVMRKTVLKGVIFTNVSMTPSTILDDADLSGAEFHGVNMTGVSLLRANLEKVIITDSVMSECKFQNAVIKNATITITELQESNMGYTSLQGACIKDCDLQEINLEGANLTKSYLIGNNLGRSNLEGANLEYAHLVKNNFTDVKLKNSVMNHSRLSGMQLNGLDMSGVEMTHLILEGVSLTNIHLKGNDISHLIADSGSIINHSSFISVNMSKSLLQESTIAFVTFTDTNIAHSVWYRLDLSSTTADRCDMSYISITGAKELPFVVQITECNLNSSVFLSDVFWDITVDYLTDLSKVYISPEARSTIGVMILMRNNLPALVSDSENAMIAEIAAKAGEFEIFKNNFNIENEESYGDMLDYAVIGILTGYNITIDTRILKSLVENYPFVLPLSFFIKFQDRYYFEDYKMIEILKAVDEYLSLWDDREEIIQVHMYTNSPENPHDTLSDYIVDTYDRVNGVELKSDPAVLRRFNTDNATFKECEDILMAETVEIKDFKGEKNEYYGDDKFIFVEEKRNGGYFSYCYSKKIIKDRLKERNRTIFFACDQKHMVTDTDTAYLRLDFPTGRRYFPMGDIATLMRMSSNVFVVYPDTDDNGVPRRIQFTASFQNSGLPHTIPWQISKNHCQGGSDISIYRIGYTFS
jgi:uncharacterized protein YjbI with pentapeptide repeats